MARSILSSGETELANWKSSKYILMKNLEGCKCLNVLVVGWVGGSESDNKANFSSTSTGNRPGQLELNMAIFSINICISKSNIHYPINRIEYQIFNIKN